VSNEHVSTVLLGARNPQQLEETLLALQVVDQLTAEVKTEIDEIVAFAPKLPSADMLSTVRAAHLTGEGSARSIWAEKK
jgi:predicted aldo/keto reductase-like oxidoreductase